MAEITTWWAVMSSDALLGYLQSAHDGEEPSEVLLRCYLDADDRMQVGPKEPDTYELARTIGPVLKGLYPHNPDVVIGREARAIAEAIAPVIGGPEGRPKDG